MAYDFHYTPTGTGVISGKEVLEQTEDAINDLGNTAISGVQEALDKAEQALTNSENAVDDAQTALNTANNAEGVAIQAQTDVGNLSGTVTNIGNRVTTAEGNITNLQGRMTTAEGNITNLQGRMTTAETNIGNLQTAVSTAQATANSAQQTATTARQQSYVFRYSGTAVVPNSTIAYSTIDNTDNIKSGDKILDVDGKLFGITAVDTANQTVTVGSALIDLALDANVVHTSGNETVGGSKTFDSNTYIYNSDNTATTPSLYLKSSKIEISSQGNTSGDQNLTYLDKNNTDYAYIKGAIQSNGSAVKIRTIAKDSSDNSVVNELQMLAYTNGNKAIFPTYSNEIDLGVSNYKWKSVSATNYYYGSNNVEFSTKFVTTDTAQTISGTKTFSSNALIYNSDNTANTPNLILQSSKIQLGDTTNSDTQSIVFNAGNSFVSKIESFKDTSGTQNLQNTVRTKDTSNNVISAMYRLRLFNSGFAFLESGYDNTISLGRNNSKWKDCQTYLINGLTPSSLSFPSNTGYVDISGYFTNTGDGQTNSYTASVNGWIYLNVVATTLVMQIRDSNDNNIYSDMRVRSNDGTIYMTIPIGSGNKLLTQWFTSSSVTVTTARFIPCQGNI